MDVLLNSRLGPELLRILVTGSLFALGMLFGWLLGILRGAGCADRPSAVRRVRY